MCEIDAELLLSSLPFIYCLKLIMLIVIAESVKIDSVFTYIYILLKINNEFKLFP